MLSAFVLAAVLLSGVAAPAGRVPLAACGLLVAFAGWTAISAAWSPVPSLARDDGLLALFYAVCLLVPLVTLRSATDRLTATVVVVLGLSALTLWTGYWLRAEGDPDLLYLGGRLDFPVTYWNGQAAMALVALWPAICLAARRHLHPGLRAAALAGAVAMACLWLGTQSKGGAVALGASTIVVFAVSGSRLRLLVPTAIVAGLGALAAEPLTEPFRAEGTAFGAAVRDAGTTTLVLAAIGAAAGLVYAFADRHVTISASIRLWAGRVALLLLSAAACSGVAAFFATVEHPVRTAQDRWADFKNIESGASASSHFGALGSNRYDFWRVAWEEFERHPLTGIGSYGWGSAYLVHGDSLETPHRSHSIELDALSETGVPGFLLVIGAGAAVLFGLARRARSSLVATGALGTAAYFAVHASGDWVWTIPATALPALVVAGIALSTDRESSLSARIAVPAGIASILVALLAFSPPWLSSRLVERAYDADSLEEASGELRWARRLDPLAVDPLLAETTFVDDAGDVRLLRRAVAKQPRSAELRFLLGRSLLDVDRKADARRELRIALSYSPRDEAIRDALEEAR